MEEEDQDLTNNAIYLPVKVKGAPCETQFEGPAASQIEGRGIFGVFWGGGCPFCV